MVPMDAEPDADADAGSSSSTSTSAPPPPSPPAYRIFLGDTHGALKLFHAQCASLPQDFQPPLPEMVKIVVEEQGRKMGAATGADRAVQKMASGHVDGVGWVIAIARKDATIDVILPPPAHTLQDELSTTTSQQALLLTSITHDKMKPGLNRWVGLAVGRDAIYACTSAGHFLFASLSIDATSSSTRPKLGISKVQRLELPEPLQTLVFYPLTNPTHFLYGGEEIPLSIWHLSAALATETSTFGAAGEFLNAEANYTAPDGEEVKQSNGAGNMNAKLRKRKRQAEARAKAKELIRGEVWRAKNLPNDSLSLPQRPNILSIAVLPCTSSAPALPSLDDSSPPPPLTIVVGTRDGLVRVYKPASGIRKHTKEVRVVLPGQGALKLLTCSSTNEGEVVAGDSAGKLYALDLSAGGRVKYQWKDITGAITSGVALPPPRFSSGRSLDSPLLFTTSFDRLLRLHTLPAASGELSKGSCARGKNLYSAFTGGAGVVASLWDGVIPVLSLQDEASAEGDGDESMRSRKNGRRGGGDGNGDDSSQGSGEDEEEVWQAMQEVGGEAEGKKSRSDGGSSSSGRSSSSRQSRKERKTSEDDQANGSEDGADGEQEEDAALEEVKERRSKRGKRGK